MRQLIFLVILVLCLAAMVAVTASPTAETLGASLQQQDVLCSTLDITFTWGGTTTYHYTKSDGVLLAEEHSAGRDAVASFDRVKHEFKATFQSKGGKVVGQLDSVTNDMLSQQTMMETALYSLYDGYLYEVVGTGTVVGKEEISGHMCYKVEAASSAPFKYIFWLDPDIGYCPRLLEIHWKDGVTQKTVTFEDYVEIGKKVYFPKAIHHVLVGPHPLDIYARIVSLTTERLHGRDALVVKFPKGIPVRGTGATFIAP